MSCKSAYYEYSEGWKCNVSGDSCMFMIPDSKSCADMFGEGPDADDDLIKTRTDADGNNNFYEQDDTFDYDDDDEYTRDDYSNHYGFTCEHCGKPVLLEHTDTPQDGCNIICYDCGIVGFIDDYSLDALDDEIKMNNLRSDEVKAILNHEKNIYEVIKSFEDIDECIEASELRNTGRHIQTIGLLTATTPAEWNLLVEEQEEWYEKDGQHFIIFIHHSKGGRICKLRHDYSFIEERLNKTLTLSGTE